MLTLSKNILQINETNNKVNQILHKDLVFTITDGSGNEQSIIAYGESKSKLLVPKLYLKNADLFESLTNISNPNIYQLISQYFKLKQGSQMINSINIFYKYAFQVVISSNKTNEEEKENNLELIQCNTVLLFSGEPLYIQYKEYLFDYQVNLNNKSLLGLPGLFSNPPQIDLFNSFLTLFRPTIFNCIFKLNKNRDSDSDDELFYLQELWKKFCIPTKSCLFQLCKGFGHIICAFYIIDVLINGAYFQLNNESQIEKYHQKKYANINKRVNEKIEESKKIFCFQKTTTLIIVHSQKQKDKWILNSQNYQMNLFVCIFNEEESFKSVFETNNIAIIIVDGIHKIPITFFIHHLNQWHVPFLFGFTKMKQNDLNPIIKHSFGPILYSFTNDNRLWTSTLNFDTGNNLKRKKNDNDIEKKAYHVLGSMFMINKSLVPESKLNEIKEELFMKPKQNDIITLTKGDDHFAFKAYLESDQFLYVPRFYGLTKFPFSLESIALLKFFNKIDSETTADLEKNFMKDFVLINEGSTIEKQYLEPCTIVPRHFQETAVNLVLNRFKTEKYSSGSIIQLACGMGKTNSALLVIHRYGKKTLVLVHTNDLLIQWVDRIHSVLPNIRIGIIQQTKCQVTKEFDIVIGLVQSIASRFDEYYLTYKEDFDSFGLCICDECHRIGNRYFSSAVARIPAKHMIGLTATPIRNDGMTTLMHHVLGPIVYARDRDTMNVNIKIIQYQPNIQIRRIYTKKIKTTNGKQNPQLYNRSRMISDLCEEPERIQLIYNIILFNIQEKRNIMFLSERTDLLFTLEKMLKLKYSNNEIIIGVSMAKTKKDVRQYVYENAQVILTTYQMSSEGLDVPRLDTLILGSPKSNIIQALGRILREYVNKQIPTVYDIYDVMDAFQGSFWSRNRLYQKENYEIEYVDQSAFLPKKIIVEDDE